MVGIRSHSHQVFSVLSFVVHQTLKQKIKKRENKRNSEGVGEAVDIWNNLRALYLPFYLSRGYEVEMYGNA